MAVMGQGVGLVTWSLLVLGALAATQVPVFRLFQFESQGLSAGSQVSNLNYVGVHHTKAAEVQRKFVVIRLLEASKEVISTLISHKPSGFLLLLPSNHTLTPDQRATWKGLEDFFGSQTFPFPIYFAWETAELLGLYEELQIQKEDDQNLLNFVVSTDEKPALRKLMLENIYGFVLEYAESLPSIALVAHYDAFSVIPELSYGLNDNGSGIIAILELARIFHKLYSQNAPSYNLLLLLTSAGTLSFEGARQWLNSEDAEIAQIVGNIQFALSLDTIGSSGGLTVHVSRFQKEGELEVTRFYTALNSTANLTDFPLTYVKKKINVADSFVPWQHENFARRKVVGATISSLDTPRTRILDHSDIFDTSVDYEALERNIRFIAEVTAKCIYAAEEKPGMLIYEKQDLVKREKLEEWGEKIANYTRYPGKLTPGAGITDLIVSNLQNYTGKSLKKKAFPLDDTILYASKPESLNIYRVKPPILEFYIFLGVLGYLAVLWIAIGLCSRMSLVSKTKAKTH
jgi:hypothetical protein